MRFNSSPDHSIYTINPGVHVLYGVVNVRINRGQLVLKANIFDNQSSLTLNKTSNRPRRLILLGTSGQITLAALQWLYDVQASIVQIGYDGSVIFASTPSGTTIPELRRVQALARDTPLGIEIMRKVIIRKAKGQLAICALLNEDDRGVRSRIEKFIGEMDNASSLDDLQLLESLIAHIYWKQWAAVPILFARKDVSRIPDNWVSFGTRISPLSKSPRRACGPGNAILNYLYALLEAETRIACLAVGLDPCIGIMHVDRLYRDSMACDLMEAVRPHVDSWLLNLLKDRRFSKSDFYETSSGQVKLTKHLCHELVQTMPLWNKLIFPVVKEISTDLRRDPDEIESFVSGELDSVVQHPYRSCIECGLPLNNQKWFCSPECRRKYEEHIPDPSFIMGGSRALKKLRSKSADPAHGGAAGRKRGTSNKIRASERKAWDSIHSQGDAEKERARFKTEILPTLEEHSLREIATSTGFCLRYASLIRSGKVVPHPVHNAKLIKLINPIELKG
jgi:CRISPR-associated endonuclease Cas1